MKLTQENLRDLAIIGPVDSGNYRYIIVPLTSNNLKFL